MPITNVFVDTVGFADGNSPGHVYNFGGNGAPAVGQLDILHVYSDTTVSTPTSSGAPWVLPAGGTHVGTMGSYVFYRIATGGEAATVTLVTAGNFVTVVGAERWAGVAAFDAVTGAFHDGGGSTTSSPAVSLPLAGTNELTSFSAGFSSLNAADPTSPVFSPSPAYAQDHALVQASNVGIFGATALNQASPTTPSVSWTNSVNNAYGYVIAFTASGGPAEVDLSATLAAAGAMTADLSVEVLSSATLAGAGSMTVDMATEIDLSATLAAGAVMSVDLGPSDVFLGVSLGSAGAMSTNLTVQSAGFTDPLALPVALQVLGCFETQLQNLSQVPALIGLRTGSAAGPLIGPNIDECCQGLAWVRVVNIYPSWEAFPAPTTTSIPCPPLAYAVVLELGAVGCFPWGSGFDGTDPPTQADWDAGVVTVLDTAAAMRNAITCCPFSQYPGGPPLRKVVGTWEPLAVEGGCTGGTMQVTVQVIAPCDNCP
jgi:hypothetical protein